MSQGVENRGSLTSSVPLELSVVEHRNYNPARKCHFLDRQPLVGAVYGWWSGDVLLISVELLCLQSV